MASTSAIVAGEAKYKGVRKRKWGKYVSEIRLPNSRDRIWLGSYDTAEKAARAFDAALFCLRGRRATFNFPDHPPDIPGGQSLSPAEIQVVAQRYGNGYAPPPPPQEEAEEEDGGARAGPVDLVDCSFWDMVDGNGGGGGASDFGLFDQGPGDDVFVSPHFETWNHEEEDGNYYEHGNMDSSLWNF